MDVHKEAVYSQVVAATRTDGRSDGVQQHVVSFTGPISNLCSLFNTSPPPPPERVISQVSQRNAACRTTKLDAHGDSHARATRSAFLLAPSQFTCQSIHTGFCVVVVLCLHLSSLSLASNAVVGTRARSPTSRCSARAGGPE